MTQTIIPVRQAQKTLEQLVRRAAGGESIFIGDNGEAEAVLSPPLSPGALQASARAAPPTAAAAARAVFLRKDLRSSINCGMLCCCCKCMEKSLHLQEKRSSGAVWTRPCLAISSNLFNFAGKTIRDT